MAKSTIPLLLRRGLQLALCAAVLLPVISAEAAAACQLCHFGQTPDGIRGDAAIGRTAGPADRQSVE